MTVRDCWKCVKLSTLSWWPNNKLTLFLCCCWYSTTMNQVRFHRISLCSLYINELETWCFLYYSGRTCLGSFTQSVHKYLINLAEERANSYFLLQPSKNVAFPTDLLFCIVIINIMLSKPAFNILFNVLHIALLSDI